MLDNDVADKLRARTDGKFRLADHDTAWVATPELESLSEKQLKHEAKQTLEKRIKQLRKAQEKLWADNRYSVLIILQAMDTAGKDSTIEHVMSGVNPQGCQVFSFKHPSAEELDHDFLWRAARLLPERGRIGIFNRSYYEEVLVVRVHPDLLAAEHVPHARNEDSFWQTRYEAINAFEKHLVHSGTVVLKFFLHVSKEEQRQRLLDRLNDPDKRWKFSLSDMRERMFWEDYQRAYEMMIAHTSTPHAPWYVVPADHKWVSRVLVSGVIGSAIEGLDIAYPAVPVAQEAELQRALRQLESEAPR